MTMRRIFASIIVIVLVLGMITCFTGCSSSKTIEFEITDSEIGGLVAISRRNEFIKGYGYNQTILYDPDTSVMYSMITGNNGITITVMYNADGTPKLYNQNK